MLFSNKQDRDKVIFLLKKDGVRIKEDLPPTVRAPKDILLGLRWKLLQWEFKNVKVNRDYTELYVGVTTVLKITMRDNKMEYEWDNEWKGWTDFLDDADVKETFTKAETILTNPAKSKSKGKNGR